MSSALHPRARALGRVTRISLLSTYPPKLCGLATFAAALKGALEGTGAEVEVIAADGAVAGRTRGPAEHVLVRGVPASIEAAAVTMSGSDVAIVQHEYGIYGGADGDEVVDLLERLTVPAVVVLHTVLASPTAHQRLVLERVCELATRVVVMTVCAETRLMAGYDVDGAKVVVIPHGATPPPDQLLAAGGRARRFDVLTWGLLGPGKGIEHVIAAMAHLDHIRPAVRYRVAGATHPNVVAHEGERYRNSLVRQAWAAGVASMVTFDDSYRDVASLMGLVARSSLVVLPYDGRDQVTSGVLVDAIAAGRPVIATAFPHAVELLSSGAGVTVPHGDPMALATEIARAACDPEHLARMTACAKTIAPSLAWSSVAARYRVLCDELVAAETAAAR